MKKYLLAFLLGPGLTAAMAQPADSVSFFLHKFALNIGKESYWVHKTDSGDVYDIKFRFVDRGSAVPLQAKLRVTKNYEPLDFWIKGKTSRFSTIHDSVVVHAGNASVMVDDRMSDVKVKAPFFTVGGYSPGTVQMLLLQYWKRHGRPASLQLLPGGTVSIKLAGREELRFGGRSLELDRFVISGLIWGNELVWTDKDGELFCLITNDAEGDKLEMMRDTYEDLLPEMIARAATYGMQLFMANAGGSARGAGASGVGKQGDGGKSGDAGVGSLRDWKRGDGTNGLLAIVGGKLIDVKTGNITDHSVVVIEKGKIIQTGVEGSVTIPKEARIINAAGKTILPGLWDMHAHFEQAEWGPAYLAAGVTTVRDCGNEFNYIDAMKAAIDDGRGIGPHIVKAGIVDGAGPLALGIIRATTPEEAIAVVHKYKDSGYVQIKLYSSVKPEIVKAISTEAHRLGLTVTGHIPEGMTLMQGVDSGMDMVNHIQYVYSVVKKNADRTINWDDPQTASVFDFVASHHVVIDPTLGVFEMIVRSTKDSITDMEPAFHTLPQPLQVLFVNIGMPAENAEKLKPMFRDWEKIVKVLYDKGVPIVAGTDMGFPGFSLDRELELYVEAGLSPLQALQTATIVPAQVMKQEAICGSIEAGKQADLLIVDGDPLQRIRDIRNVKTVIKDGAIYDPAALHKMAGFVQ